jgi:hypothetical protein
VRPAPSVGYAPHSRAGGLALNDQQKSARDKLYCTPHARARRSRVVSSRGEQESVRAAGAARSLVLFS